MTQTSSSKNSNHTNINPNRPDTGASDRAYEIMKLNNPQKQGEENQNLSRPLQERERNLTVFSLQQKKSSDRSTVLVKNQGYSRIQPKFSLKTKATAWALAISMLPVLATGIVTAFTSRSIEKKIVQARETGNVSLVEKERELQEQLQGLLIWTGATAAIAGAIAVILANLAIRPVLKVAAAYTKMAHRLLEDEDSANLSVMEKDELAALQNNISLIEEKLSDLLKTQEAEIKSSQVLIKITRNIWKSLSEEDILRTTTKVARKALAADRVTVLRFEENWKGTFIDESVAPGWPKILGTRTDESYFDKEDLGNYQYGRISVIHDLSRKELLGNQTRLWQGLGVKAVAIAPILTNNHLFGLLIVHQCSESRNWEQAEADLLAQLASQLGLALECAKRLESLDTKAQQAQIFIDVTRRIRESLNEEDILTTTVEEVRKAIRADRVTIYGLDTKWNEIIVAESVLPGFPKALWNQVKDSCFSTQNYTDLYKNGRVQAIDNIYEASLDECYLKQLETYAVKAYLIAPILKDSRLFGLLIAHQCSAPREWRQGEINLFTQLAMQVGLALNHSRLLEKVDSEAKQSKLICEVTRRIRAALKEQDVIKIATEEIRKALRADRIILSSFNPERYGTVIAESVIPGLRKMLSSQIKDAYFTEDYIEKYETGKICANNNIYELGLKESQIQQLELFGVKADLIVPIIKEDRIFGILIAHQCSEVRQWQQSEIDLFAQLAIEVGFALEHAKVSGRMEQTDLAIDVAFGQRLEQKHKKSLHDRVAEMLKDSKTTIETLSNESQSWMEFATTAYNQIQSVTESAQEMTGIIELAKNQDRQVDLALQDAHQSMNQIVEGIFAIREGLSEATKKVKVLDRSPQKLLELLERINSVASQMKMQAMNAALKASRTDEAERDFTSVAERFISLVEQLEGNIAKLEPIIVEIKADTDEVAVAMNNGKQQIFTGTELVGETKEKLNQIAAASVKMTSLIDKIAQASVNQSQTSTSASQAVLGVASLASHTSEQSALLVQSLNKLEAFAQEL